ncbi:MAG: gamma carbonic anhydrase family protein [Promethearchaeota archaeon]
MPLIEYNGKKPKVSEKAHVSPTATLVGDVQVLDNAVVWPGSVLRAENAPITVGEYSTVFDGVMIFTRSEKSAVVIGNYCIIETGCALFGVFMEDYVTLSQNSCVYEGASIGEGVVVLPESVVPSGMIVPARVVLKGNPVQTVREQNREAVMLQKERAENYSELFVKILHQLPNAPNYVLTLPDLVKILLNLPGYQLAAGKEGDGEDSSGDGDGSQE